MLPYRLHWPYFDWHLMSLGCPCINAFQYFVVLLRLGRRKPLCFYSVVGGVTCILAGALSKDTGLKSIIMPNYFFQW